MWEWLSVSALESVGNAMLVARGRATVVDAESNNDARPIGTGASERTVIDFEASHGQVLFGFVRRLGVHDAAAADVVQESLLRLFDALRAGQEIRDLKSWTFHVAYRLAMDEHRRSARGLRVVKASSRPPGPADPGDDLELRQVWSEVDHLPDRQRAVLYLRYRADLAFEDVGLTMGITASAARSHCTQALAALRARLGNEAL